MKQHHRDQLFDNWAQHYDSTVASAGNTFPFDGYDQVLDEVVRLADVKPHLRVLDLGIGTGNLAARFLRQGREVWGISVDEDEHYWAADETRVACERAGLRVAYHQVSSCGGVFVFTHRDAA